VALWRLESTKLTLDSIGTNKLTNENNGVVANLASFKEGESAARFKIPLAWDDRNWLSIPDANLAANFPGKSGTTNKKFTISLWVYFDVIPAVTKEWPLITKMNWGTNSKSYGITCIAGGQIALYAGTDQQLVHGSFVTAGRWYHVTATFNDATHTGTIRIWDDTAGAILGTDAQKTNFGPMVINNASLLIGGWQNSWWSALPGLLDEVVVFNDVLTSQEMNKVRAGTYGKP
jgi:hypothetical protein